MSFSLPAQDFNNAWENTNADSGKARLVPSGMYNAEIVGIEKDMKDGKPLENSRSSFLAMHLDCGDGNKLVDLVFLSDRALWRFVKYCKACNCFVSDPSDVNYGGLLHRFIQVEVEIESKPRRDGMGTFDVNVITNVSTCKMPNVNVERHDLSNPKFRHIDCSPPVIKTPEVSSGNLPF